MLVGYSFTDGSEMKFGPNQHNNQLIYYIRDIKVLGAAHSYALDDQISGWTYVCYGGGFEEMIHNNILSGEVG